MIFKQLPNVLTLSRLFLIVPFLWFLYKGNFTYAFYIFLIAALSDALDGWVARNYQCQTDFGSFIDPMADKLLTATSFISLAILHQLPLWLVALVFLRDLTISLGILAWYYFMRKSLTFKPTWLSKLNTGLQLALVISCLFQLAFFNLPDWLINALIICTTVTTLSSYIDYVWTWGKKAYANSHVT